MYRVVHFEIAARNPERIGAFYQTLFGWKLHRWDGAQEYWLVETGSSDDPGINGGIMKREGGTVNTIDVPSVDDFVEKVTAAGGEVVVPKRPVAGVGYLAYCKDPEGNLFGIHHTDRSAR